MLIQKYHMKIKVNSKEFENLYMIFTVFLTLKQNIRLELVAQEAQDKTLQYSTTCKDTLCLI